MSHPKSRTDPSASIENADPRVVKRAVVAALIGNVVEWYEFFTYAFLATTLAGLFFPSDNPTASLMATFAAFAGAFLVRPLGGLIFGHLGDKFGRKGVLALVIILMSLATAGIGVLPTHASVGALAAVLLVVCRVVQGLSAAGEYVGATTLVIEYAPRTRRGVLVSLVTASTAVGCILSAGVVLSLESMLSASQFDSWGWRVPFLLALPLGVIGLYIRSRIEETPAYKLVKETAHIEKMPLVKAISENFARLLVIFVYISLFALSFYMLATYITTYLTEVTSFSRSEALLANIFVFAVYAVAVPFFGYISDLYGRNKVLLGSSVGFLVFSIPTFMMTGSGSIALAAVGMGILAVCTAACGASTTLMLMEIFPTRVRYSASSIAYNSANVVFAGTAGLVATWLVSATGSAIAPAVYIMVVAAVTLVVALATRMETRERQL